MAAKLTVIASVPDENRTFVVKGRDAWALLELVRMATRGCTPIENIGPRWAAYIHNLKRQHGLDIVTLHEPHFGRFPGNHARYVLRTKVVIVRRSDAPIGTAA